MIRAMPEDISRSDGWPNTKETRPRRGRNSPQLKNFGAKPIRASSHPEFKSHEIPSERASVRACGDSLQFSRERDCRDAARPRASESGFLLTANSPQSWHLGRPAISWLNENGPPNWPGKILRSK